MKTKLIKLNVTFILTMIIILVTGCYRLNRHHVDKLLDNDQTRMEIFQAILHDRQKLNLFMEEVIQDSNALNLIVNNKSMIAMVCAAPALDTVLVKNKVAAHQLMSRMISASAKDTLLSGMMMEMIRENQDMMSRQDHTQVKPK